MGQDRYVAYVGTYTHEHSIGIHVYDIDMEKGALIPKDVAQISNPSNICVAHSGKFLYSIEDEGVAAFSIAEDGTLTKINQEWIGGMRACFVTIDSKDRFLFLGGFHDGRVTSMKLNSDGSIGGIADGIFHQGIGKSAIDHRMDPHVTCVKLTPDEEFLCAVDWGLNQIKIYDIDYRNGKLSVEDIIRCQLGAAPRKMLFSHGGTRIYVLEEGKNEIEIFSYSLTRGRPNIEFLDSVSVLDSDRSANIADAYDMAMTSDGEYIYVSLDGIDCISVMRMEPGGLLSFEQMFPISGDFPKALQVLPDNKTVVSLNHASNEIRTFNINHKDKFALMKNKPIKVDKPNSIIIFKLPEQEETNSKEDDTKIKKAAVQTKEAAKTKK